MHLQARWNEIHIGGGAEQGANKASKDGGITACPWKNFSDHILDIFGGCPILEMLPLNEEKSQLTGVVPGRFEIFELYGVKRYCTFDRFW